MLITSGAVFKFHTTKVGCFSSDLTYGDSRHSNDDKDCRVMGFIGIVGEVEQQEESVNIVQIGKN